MGGPGVWAQGFGFGNCQHSVKVEGFRRGGSGYFICKVISTFCFFERGVISKFSNSYLTCKP